MMRTLLTILIALVLILVYFSLPSYWLHSNDEGPRYIQMKSFYLNHWKRLDIEYPGKKIGLGFRFLTNDIIVFLERGGSLYCVYPSLFTFLSSFLYPFLGSKATLFLPLLSFFLSIVILAKTLKMMMKPGILYYVLLSGFVLGSPVLVYSFTFWEHVPATCLVVLSLYYLTAYFRRSRSGYNLFMSAFILGISVFLRTDMLFLLFAFSLTLAWVLLKNREMRMVVILAAGAILPVALFMITNLILYGNFFSIHVIYGLKANVSLWRIVAMLALLASRYLFYFLNKQEDRQALRKLYDFMIIIWLGIVLLFLRDSPASAFFLGFPLAFVLFFNAGKTIEDFFGPKPQLEQVVFSTTIVFITLIAIFFYRSVDISVRFLIPAVPLILLFLGIKGEEITRFKPLYLTVFILVVFGVLSSSSALKNKVFRYGYYNYERVRFLQANTRKDDCIIFQSNPLMEHCGPLFFERIYIVSKNRGRDLREILDMLKAKGIRHCYYWNMDPNFVKRFSAETDYKLSQDVFISQKGPRHYLIRIELAS